MERPSCHHDPRHLRVGLEDDLLDIGQQAGLAASGRVDREDGPEAHVRLVRASVIRGRCQRVAFTVPRLVSLDVWPPVVIVIVDVEVVVALSAAATSGL